MSISPLSKQFDPLTRQEILALHPGKWSDEDLLKVVKYFEGEKKDRDRAMAVTELILGSPQMGILDYDMLYLDIIGYYRWKDDFPAALRWAYAFIAFGEQHENGLNRDNHIRDLAEICLEAGDLNTGLALFTRLAQTSPDDIWNFNTLSFGLPRAGLPGLALEVLDRALVLTAEKDPEHLKKQLADQRREVEERLPGTPDCSDEISPEVLADFRAALLSPTPNRSKSTGKKKNAPYLPPTSQLLNESQAGNASLEAEILAQGKVLIPELIQMAFDEELPVEGAPTLAIKLLRQLHTAHAAELGALSTWLDRASGDWRNELLTRSFAKIGGYTTSGLEAIVADVLTDASMRISALEALSERVKRLRAQQKRFTVFAHTMLTRPEADSAGEETIVGYLIGDVLDLNLRVLYPEIERAFVEDRVDTKVITPLEVQSHWGLLPKPWPKRREDGLYLRLRCTACNRIREHFVQNIILELNTLEKEDDENPTAYGPYIMDHEIVCPKCGAVDHYAMTPMAHLTLFVAVNKPGNLADLLSGKKMASDFPLNPRVHPFRSTVFGQPMHLLAGLEEYRRRIRANPLDAILFMKMGTLLRTLYRNSDALEAHRHAYALNPNDAEIALVLGFSEHDFGDHSAATKMYEQVLTLELKGKGIWNMARSDTYAGAAIEGLERLKQRQSSAWELKPHGSPGGEEKKATLNSQAPSSSSQKRHRRRGR